MRNVRMAIAASLLALMPSIGFAATGFEGVWNVKDSAGKPFQITLSPDGTAKATRAEGMTGTWSQEGDSAVIKWTTGWTTKITKEGDHYSKTAYAKGQSPDSSPKNSSSAEKAQ
ncbi:MAG TPA: hypothetical protein VKV77_09620 [Methylovirgula sp.]|nr:hypothetical protein [Methylovirgula sp.]